MTLGSGGLSMTDTESSSGGLFVSAPLTLSGNQVWNVTGPSPTSGVHALTTDLSFQNDLHGESSNLTINLTGQAFLVFGLDVPEAPVLDDELGNVTLNGETGGNGGVVRLVSADLNASVQPGADVALVHHSDHGSQGGLNRSSQQCVGQYR